MRARLTDFVLFIGIVAWLAFEAAERAVSRVVFRREYVLKDWRRKQNEWPRIGSQRM